MWTLLTISLVIVSGTVSENQTSIPQACGLQKSVPLVNRTYAGVTFSDNETIIDPKDGTERGCVCLKQKCARKCCPFGQIYKFDDQKCINNTENIKFDPPVLEERNQQYSYKEGFNATKEFIFIIGKMVCERETKGERRLPVGPSVSIYNLTEDGNFLMDVPSNVPSLTIYEPDKYCIDTFVSDELEPHLNALICYVVKPETNNYALSSSCMLISCFFILLTVAVYAWVPELRNLHGMVLMAYLISFFVGFLFLATMQILILRKDIAQNLCTSFTFIIYFSLLSAFFWLNIMCYDIWWTFSGKRAHGLKGSAFKRFLHYAVYAFGIPIVLTIILASLEFADLPGNHPLLPRIRLQGCFLYGNSKLLYLYGPIVILCVANMTFFGLTAYKIWKIKRETQMLRGGESSTHSKEGADRFSLYLKLFTVMGVNWILEVISSFYPEADFIWQFTDAYNVLVGFIIFIIFVAKRKTWDMIKNRYLKMRGKAVTSRAPATLSTSETQSSSRDEIQMDSIKNT